MWIYYMVIHPGIGDTVWARTWRGMHLSMCINRMWVNRYGIMCYRCQHGNNEYTIQNKHIDKILKKGR